MLDCVKNQLVVCVICCVCLEDVSCLIDKLINHALRASPTLHLDGNLT